MAETLTETETGGLRILVVEDDPQQRDALATRLGVDLPDATIDSAGGRAEACSELGSSLPELALVIADMHLGALDPQGGLEIVRHADLVRLSDGCDAPVIVLTAFGDLENARECMEAGAFSYVMKGAERDGSYRILLPTIHRALEARRTRREMRRLERLKNDVMADAICAMVDSHEPYTGGHSRRVAAYAKLIAAALGDTAGQQELARLAGLVHDMGKVGLDAEILSRPAKLPPILFGAIRAHPLVGYTLLKQVHCADEIALAVLDHHMRVDGSGYPSPAERAAEVTSGPAGPTRLGQIIGVADSFDAMTTPRPYLAANGRDKIKEALKKLRNDAARAKPLYDPILIEALALAIPSSACGPGIWRTFVGEVKSGKLPVELLDRNIGEPPDGLPLDELDEARKVLARLQSAP